MTTLATSSIPVVRLDEEELVQAEPDTSQAEELLTPDERRDFDRLDRRVDKNHRQLISDYREIRDRRLYRENFSTLDAYMAAKGHTRQWLTRELNWLRRVELLEELAGKPFGKPPYQMSVEEAQKLGPLEPDYDDEDCDHELCAKLFVQALVEAQAEAEALGKTRTVDMTQRAVRKRVNYLNNLLVFGNDLTLDESVQIDRLGGHQNDEIEQLLESAREGAAKEGRSCSDCLKELVDQTVKDDERREQEEKLLAEKKKREAELEEIDDKLSEVDVGDVDVEEPAEDEESLEDEDFKEEPTVDGVFEISVTGDFADVCGFKEELYTSSDLAQLFSEFADDCMAGAIRKGTISVEVIDNEKPND